jgi:phosphoenolpyruvate phosphomutase / 2-hydroxyethylphosphonate cytidylyltransferase
VESTVLILGSFDVALHGGHLQVLNQAARLGRVVVGLGTDEYQAGYKRIPYCTYEERKWMLEQAGYEVAARDEVSIKGLVREVKPDYLAAGSDWIGKPYLELSGIDGAWLESQGIALVYLPRDHDMSTTELIARVRT